MHFYFVEFQQKCKLWMTKIEWIMQYYFFDFDINWIINYEE
jgi:hypothetical protein